MRLLFFGVASDFLDKKLGTRKSTVYESTLGFCNVIIFCFENECLRAPTDADIKRILQQSDASGFRVYWFCSTA